MVLWDREPWECELDDAPDLAKNASHKLDGDSALEDGTVAGEVVTGVRDDGGDATGEGAGEGEELAFLCWTSLVACDPAREVDAGAVRKSRPDTAVATSVTGASGVKPNG